MSELMRRGWARGTGLRCEADDRSSVAPHLPLMLINWQSSALSVVWVRRLSTPHSSTRGNRRRAWPSCEEHRPLAAGPPSGGRWLCPVGTRGWGRAGQPFQDTGSCC